MNQHEEFRRCECTANIDDPFHMVIERPRNLVNAIAGRIGYMRLSISIDGDKPQKSWFPKLSKTDMNLFVKKMVGSDPESAFGVPYPKDRLR